VAGKLHRDALRHAGANQVPDRRAAKIVRDAAEQLGAHNFANSATLFVRCAIDCRQPCASEVSDGFSVTMKHVRDNPTRGPFHGLGAVTLFFQ